ncbi:MAG: SDR family NAD(P)-dependent oxidoreductase [Myxococcales bacterium]|jgi:NAD(P)-dependent dehydrogenase (short-subunit alcohol dehydrogenase family)|nr:SDR family NAD(P)-dependent oxidoreductase [Myxococcales bacterium]
MYTHQGKVVVITGAGSGIGRATALAFSAAGARVHATDVDEEGLRSLAAERGAVATRRVDVSKRDEVEALAAHVEEAEGRVDVVVNNAGVGLAGGLLQTTTEDWEWIVSINMWGVIHGCRAFAPKMAERKRGHIVNVSSVLGYYGAPSTVAYSTTKFAVFGLSEALRAELADHGVGVTTVCPGIIDTNIVKTGRFRPRKGDPLTSRDKALSVWKKRSHPPQKVAQAILEAVEKNRAVVPVTPEAWALYYAKRAAPGLGAALGKMVSKR